MSDKSPPRPQPNWRDASSYSYTKDLSREAWAWEFLRRNPAHRSSWRRSLERGLDVPMKGSKTATDLTTTTLHEAGRWGVLTFRGS